jgi:hypothetical protein
MMLTSDVGLDSGPDNDDKIELFADPDDDDEDDDDVVREAARQLAGWREKTADLCIIYC